MHMRFSVPNWLIRSGCCGALRVLEQERRPAGLDDAVDDLGDLEVGVDLGRDADELALLLEEGDPLAQVGGGARHAAQSEGCRGASGRASVGTVTLVFTDIEGSTRLLEELGVDAYRDALAEHRRVVREACARHDGYEVDYEGDAFFYAFASAQAAVARGGRGDGRPRRRPDPDPGRDPHRRTRAWIRPSTSGSTSTAPPGS